MAKMEAIVESARRHLEHGKEQRAAVSTDSSGESVENHVSFPLFKTSTL